MSRPVPPPPPRYRVPWGTPTSLGGYCAKPLVSSLGGAHPASVSPSLRGHGERGNPKAPPPRDDTTTPPIILKRDARAWQRCGVTAAQGHGCPMGPLPPTLSTQRHDSPLTPKLPCAPPEWGRGWGHRCHTPAWAPATETGTGPARGFAFKNLGGPPGRWGLVHPSSAPGLPRSALPWPPPTRALPPPSGMWPPRVWGHLLGGICPSMGTPRFSGGWPGWGGPGGTLANVPIFGVPL